MPRKLRALDLFAGGGGASIGLHQAGFKEIVGIDIAMHKNYPFDFIQADVHNLPVDIHDFDFVWASPPCQRFSTGIVCNKTKYPEKEYPNLIPITRKILCDHPFVCIENVMGAPIRANLILNGAAMGLPFIERRRKFELSFYCWNPALPKNAGFTFTVRKRNSAFNKEQIEKWRSLGLKTCFPKVFAKAIMGIPYFQEMTEAEIGEAVPPAYSEYIAREAIRQMTRKEG